MLKITQKRLKELLIYDPDTGIFRWRISRGRIKAGAVAGTYNKGYLRIGILGCIYYAHRLAFFYVNGVLPEYEIDHINRVKDDNRISNLRDVTHTDNNRNHNKYRNSSSGLCGVSWIKSRRIWRSHIRVDGHLFVIGFYTDKEEAGRSYDASALKYFGEFAVLNFPEAA